MEEGRSKMGRRTSRGSVVDRVWSMVPYLAALLLWKIISALPLRCVAAIGRWGGGVAWWVDRRHRAVALLNLARCFREQSEAERRSVCREHFRRLGENYACAIKTSAMTREALQEHFEVMGGERLLAHGDRGVVVAVGHFGNFELHARLNVNPLRVATTYRPLKQPRLDGLVRRLREQSGALFFDRKRQTAELRAALARGGIALGLLADQHAGSRGMRLPFLEHPCSVTAAPALLAQRYRLPLHTAFIFRVSPARWRLEIGEEIPTYKEGARRHPAAVMLEVNAAFERAVLRDPANWFWVHDRWRFKKGVRPRTASPTVQPVSA